METFRVAHLVNKFWTSNSIKVPNRPIIIDEGFKTLEQIWDSIEQKEYSMIEWIEYLVTGSIMLPGEWNYCFYKGKYFHLEKVESNGFLHNGTDEHGANKGIECFIYQLIYDDWQNEWLTNNIYINGSINLTGDKELVKRHLLQTTPLVNNVNSFEYLNGVLGDINVKTKVKLPDDLRVSGKWGIVKDFSPIDITNINKFLSTYDFQPPNREKLILPWVYRTSTWGNWKLNLLMRLRELNDKRVSVYDVSYDAWGGNFKPILETLLGSPEVYTIAPDTNRIYSLSKSKNASKYVDTVDLTGVTDFIELNPTSLTPKYNEQNPEPRFTISGLCEKMRTRLGWGSDLQKDMEDAVLEEIGKGLHYVLLGGFGGSNEWRDVTVEKIDRDVIYTTRDFDQRTNTYKYETPIIYKNPRWIKAIDIIPYRKNTLNGIFEATTPETIVSRKIIAEFSDDESITPNHKCWRFATSKDGEPLPTLGVHVDPTAPTHVQSIPALNLYLNSLNTIQTNNTTEETNILNCFESENFISTTDHLTKGLLLDNKNLVLPITHTEKLKTESDEIDFSRGIKYGDKYLALLPDYTRNCHVLAVSNYLEHPTLKWPDDDVINENKGNPINITTFDEYVQADSTNELDLNHPPHNFMNLWYDKVTEKRDRNYMLGDLSHKFIGLANALISNRHADYRNKRNKVVYKHYHSYCGTNKNSPAGCLTPTPKSLGYRYQQGTYTYYRTTAQGFNIHATLPPDVDRIFKNTYYKNFEDYLKRQGDILGDDVLSYTWIGKDISKGSVGNMYKTIIDGKLEQRNDQRELISIWLGIQDYDSSYRTEYSFAESILRLFEKDWDNLTDQSGISRTPPIPLFSTLRNDPKKWEYTLIKAYKGHYYVFTIVGDYETFNSNDNNCNWWNVTPNGFANLWKDGEPAFVANVPDLWENSGRPVSDQRYILKTNDVNLYKRDGTYNSDAVLALLGFSNSAFEWGNINWDSYLNAHQKREFFNKYFLKNHNILFNNFIKNKIKTDRTNNPKKFIRLYKHTINGDKIELPITESISQIIPPFIGQYLDPDRPISSILHEWKKWTGGSSNRAKLVAWKSKIQEACNTAMRLLSEYHTIFKLQGTEWYAVALLNTSKDIPQWEFELLTDNIENIKTKDVDYWKFKNTNQTNDVDVMINTNYELNIYGSRHPLKTRYFSDESTLDIGLKIKALEDVKQTEAAIWYSVDLITNGQDLIRTVIETPKELVKYTTINLFERERLIREISQKSIQRNADINYLAIEESKFKKLDELDRRVVTQRAHEERAQAFASIISGGIGLATRDDPSSAVGSILSGIITIAGATHRESLARERLNINYETGMARFKQRGVVMAEQHKNERETLLDRLREMSAKIRYPQLSNALAYKIYNTYQQLNDVYLVRYQPSGNLLNYIKNYYLENGYEILVRDFECIGASSVKRHLKFANIHILKHPIERVRSLIETRALTGIYMIDWAQAHY